jgi:hypothetical protein
MSNFNFTLGIEPRFRATGVSRIQLCHTVPVMISNQIDTPLYPRHICPHHGVVELKKEEMWCHIINIYNDSRILATYVIAP